MRIGASLACFGACIASVVGRKSASGPREALESCLDAAGVRSEFKGDARFDADTLAFNRRFRDRPTVIVFPTSGKQVAAAVKCANKADVTIQPRSGGHSYIAQSLSSGMTIDLAGLAAVKLHSDNTVDVGGGARLGKVITTLNAHGRALPTGTCPDVGVGGHAAFGGYGASAVSFSCPGALSAAEAADALGRTSLPELTGRLPRPSLRPYGRPRRRARGRPRQRHSHDREQVEERRSLLRPARCGRLVRSGHTLHLQVGPGALDDDPFDLCVLHRSTRPLTVRRHMAEHLSGRRDGRPVGLSELGPQASPG